MQKEKAIGAGFTLKNILALKDAKETVLRLKSKGKKVGLCHGGFDLLHPGHVKHFESAASKCDVLFVSVTSDRFVSRRKGQGRPVFPETLRAYMAASVRFVDYAVITDFETAREVLLALKPTYYIKGPDYDGKKTPGILGEINAIESIGGKVIFTKDEKLSTSALIERIKNGKKRLLICTDRDGTLIEKVNYLGREKKWQEQARLITPVAEFIRFLQSAHDTLTIGITNQAGVALGYFPEGRVREINEHVASLLQEHGAVIDLWEYCPDADLAYAKKKGLGMFLKNHVLEKTKRKPGTQMVLDGLKKAGRNISDFGLCLVLGDAEDDMLLAKNLRCKFIDVKGKSLQELKEDFSSSL